MEPTYGERDAPDLRAAHLCSLILVLFRRLLDLQNNGTRSNTIFMITFSSTFEEQLFRTVLGDEFTRHQNPVRQPGTTSPVVLLGEGMTRYQNPVRQRSRGVLDSSQ